MSPPVVPISSPAEFDQFESRGQSPLVALFFATWHEPCKQMLSLVGQLAEDFPSVAFVTIDADQVPELAKRFKVSSAPTTIIFKNNAEVERIESADVKGVAKAVERVAESSDDGRSSALDLRRLVSRRPVMLFMKGSPDQPRCGFSAKLVALLKSKNVDFGYFDILSDDRVRQDLKTFANWQTYPQLWIKGQFVGGLDIVSELDEAGELDEMLQNSVPSQSQAQGSLQNRLKSLITSSHVMVFMKGTLESPQCGFSKKLVDILKSHQVEFGSFNILEDNEVREGLKKFSQWPTYPQVYVRGELVGGLDIITELEEAGELDDALAV